MLSHSCTVYNKCRENGVELYRRRQLTGVYWQAGNGVTYLHNSVNLDGGLLLVIPCGAVGAAGYLPPLQWQARAEKSGRWTLQTGDLVVWGECPLLTVTGAAVLKKAYDGVFTITGVTDYSQSGQLAHWEVRGK